MLELIVGQKIAKRMLINEIKRGLLPQTLLFFGPEGSGKFLTALEVSRIINCFENASDSCNCKSCYAVRRLNSPNIFILSKANLENSFEIWFKYGVDDNSFPFFYRDVIRLILQRRSQIITKMRSQKKSPEKIEVILDEEIGFLRESITSFEVFQQSNIEDIFEAIRKVLIDSKEKVITIDEIRSVQRFLQHTSGSFKKKVVIIDGAEYMNEEASNSFLKISEDTPENSVIIMTAVNKNRIKDTIISRARNYRFTSLTTVELKEILYRLYKRDIFLNKQSDHNEDIKIVLEEILNNKNNFEVLLNKIQNILKVGREVDVIDYVKSLYINKIRESSKLTIEDVYELENRIKRLSEEKLKLKSTNVNKELSFTNFIVNDLLK